MLGKDMARLCVDNHRASTTEQCNFCVLLVVSVLSCSRVAANVGAPGPLRQRDGGQGRDAECAGLGGRHRPGDDGGHLGWLFLCVPVQKCFLSTESLFLDVDYCVFN